MAQKKKALSSAEPPERAAKKEAVNIIPHTAEKESVFIRVPEAMEIMDCSRSTAQRCFAMINRKLKEKGFFTIAGRCNRRAFYEAIGKE